MASLTRAVVRKIVNKLVRNTILKIATAVAGGITLAFTQLNRALGLGGRAATSPFGMWAGDITLWIHSANQTLVAVVGANSTLAPLVIIGAWAFAVVLTGGLFRFTLEVVKWI